MGFLKSTAKYFCTAIFLFVVFNIIISRQVSAVAFATDEVILFYNGERITNNSVFYDRKGGDFEQTPNCFEGVCAISHDGSNEVIFYKTKDGNIVSFYEWMDDMDNFQSEDALNYKTIYLNKFINDKSTLQIPFLLPKSDGNPDHLENNVYGTPRTIEIDLANRTILSIKERKNNSPIPNSMSEKKAYSANSNNSEGWTLLYSNIAILIIFLVVIGVSLIIYRSNRRRKRV